MADKRNERSYLQSKGRDLRVEEFFFSLAKVQETLKGVFFTIGAALLAVVVNGFRNAIQTIIDFERENSKLAGILGTSVKGVKELTDEARRLGATTSYTASQVTQLQIELAKLGFAKEEIKAMTPGVLQFAKAVGTDLASAASFAGATMRIFNISMDGAKDMLASLAISTNKSALNFSFLQSAMSTVGPVAYAFGFTVRDTAALLGNLANAGFDASSAATASRNILLNLADGSGKLAQAIGGPVKTLDELVAGLQKLNAAGVDLNQALELTDKRSVAAFEKFLQGADSITELRNNITGCVDQFDAMSKTMGDNVQGSLNALSSATEGVVLKFYEASGPLKMVVDLLTALVGWVGNAIDFTVRHAKAITMVAAAYVGYKAGLLVLIPLKKAYNALIAKGTAATLLDKAVMAEMMILQRGYRALLLAGAAAKALLTGNILRARAAMILLNTAIKANPIGLLVSIITTAIAAWMAFKDRTKESEKAVNDHRKAMEDYRRSVSDISSQTASYAEKELVKLRALYDSATNDLRSREKRLEAVRQLQKMYPQYFGQIDKESIMIGRARDKYDQLTKSILRAARARAAQDKITENMKEVIDLEMQRDRDIDERDALQLQYDQSVREEGTSRYALKKGFRVRRRSTGKTKHGHRLSRTGSVSLTLPSPRAVTR